MLVHPVPLTLGARVTRALSGRSHRRLYFESASKTGPGRVEVDSTTTFDFAIESTVTSVDASGAVSELRFRVLHAAFQTVAALVSGASIPPWVSTGERPLGLEGIEATIRREGPTVIFTPSSAVTSDNRFPAERLTAQLLGRRVSELDPPSGVLVVGTPALAYLDPVRQLLGELSWARVASSGREEVTVGTSAITDSPSGPMATMDVAVDSSDPQPAFGSALHLRGTLIVSSEGRPVSLTLTGTTTENWTTMRGRQGGSGEVELRMTWE